MSHHNCHGRSRQNREHLSTKGKKKTVVSEKPTKPNGKRKRESHSWKTKRSVFTMQGDWGKPEPAK